MLRVFETFSGIGSQAKALRNAGIEHEILATADWDVSAIIAYDLIHNGPPVPGDVDDMITDEVETILDGFTLSLNGKTPATKRSIHQMPEEAKRRLLAAIRRSNNLVSMTRITGQEVPDNLDLLTYSFPCQDLSLCKFWHGNVYGLDRDAHTRSGMLWEVERILREMRDCGRRLPRFLVMENVCAILNSLNKKNFTEWKTILEEFGYMNIIYRLNASSFGIPQNRERAYMISVLYNNDMSIGSRVFQFFRCENDLENPVVVQEIKRRDVRLCDILRIDYSNPVFRAEADESQPNDTESRRDIYKSNTHLLNANGDVADITVNTVTTKQDRDPNSGVIEYSGREGGACYRNLTPRECFMLMGFDEADYEILLANNLTKDNKSMIFSRDKLNKLAGNSIVVDVLEAIFKSIDKLNTILWGNDNG